MNKQTKKILLFCAPLLPIIGVAAWASIHFTKQETSDSASNKSKETKKLNDNKNSEKKDLGSQEDTVKVEEIEKPQNNSTDDENAVLVLRVKKALPKLNDLESNSLNKPKKENEEETNKEKLDSNKKDEVKDNESNKQSNNDENLTPEEKREKEEKINEIKTKTSDWIKNQLISYFFLTPNEINFTLKEDLKNITKKIEQELNLENTNLQDLKDENKIRSDVEKLIDTYVTLQASRPIVIDETNYFNYFNVSEEGKRSSKDDQDHKPSVVFNKEKMVNGKWKGIDYKKYWFVDKQASDVYLKFDVVNKDNRDSLFVKFVEIVVPGEEKFEQVNKSHFKEYFYLTAESEILKG